MDSREIVVHSAQIVNKTSLKKENGHVKSPPSESLAAHKLAGMIRIGSSLLINRHSKVLTQVFAHLHSIIPVHRIQTPTHSLPIDSTSLRSTSQP